MAGVLRLCSIRIRRQQRRIKRRYAGAFEDASSSTYYAFTLPEHPAHPAWITRKLVDRDGEVVMDLIGYFAGDEEPFSELFQDYAELTYQIRSDLEAQKETEE